MGLSAAQGRICEYLLRYENEQGYPPTVREISAATGLKSSSTVHFHLKGLKRAGVINIQPGKSRTISLNYDKIPPEIIASVFPDGVQPPQKTQPPQNVTVASPEGVQPPRNVAAASRNELQPPRNVSETPVPDHTQIPVFSSISMENFIPSGETVKNADIEGYFTFDPGERQGKYFALRVREMSVKVEGILPGDLIVVRCQRSVRKGEIAAAFCNGGTTLRRFPGKCSNGADVHVFGKVTAVVRLYEP